MSVLRGRKHGDVHSKRCFILKVNNSRLVNNSSRLTNRAVGRSGIYAYALNKAVFTSNLNLMDSLTKYSWARPNVNTNCFDTDVEFALYGWESVITPDCPLQNELSQSSQAHRVDTHHLVLRESYLNMHCSSSRFMQLYRETYVYSVYKLNVCSVYSLNRIYSKYHSIRSL